MAHELPPHWSRKLKSAINKKVSWLCPRAKTLPSPIHGWLYWHVEALVVEVELSGRRSQDELADLVDDLSWSDILDYYCKSLSSREPKP